MSDHQKPVIKVQNMAHQHAFVMVGEDNLFGVHQTQYHCELHKYQIIIKFSVDKKTQERFVEMRKQAPRDTFMLVNKGEIIDGDMFGQFSIPDLANGSVKKFAAGIYQGLPPFPEEAALDHHFIPWQDKYTQAVIPDVVVEVERIVFFLPLAHHTQLPPFATYFLFGQDNEAHITNLQTAQLATGPFEPEAFGPDYDHVMSLMQAPSWLDKPMLESGIVITTPKVRLLDPVSGEPTIPCSNLFAEGETIEVLYRGMGERLHIEAGCTFLQLTAVCNGPGGSYLTERVMPCDLSKNPGYISQTPRVYWAAK